MRTFIIKARKASANPEKLRTQVGSKDHFEVILHSIMNAFFLASDFRQNVEVYIIFDGAHDFPLTLKLSSQYDLSFPGFDEQSILKVITQALSKTSDLKKNQLLNLSLGIDVFGFGLETLIKTLVEQQRSIFILDKKGEAIRELELPDNPVFLLSDHLMMPKKTLMGLTRRGLRRLSLGKKMLFASQCVVLIQHELDVQGLE